jgi:hypothetical protein
MWTQEKHLFLTWQVVSLPFPDQPSGRNIYYMQQNLPLSGNFYAVLCLWAVSSMGVLFEEDGMMNKKSFILGIQNYRI